MNRKHLLQKNIEPFVLRDIIFYKDGSRGYIAYGEDAEILLSFGAAENVSQWGALVKPDIIKTLGKSFYYRDLVAYKAAQDGGKESQDVMYRPGLFNKSRPQLVRIK